MGFKTGKNGLLKRTGKLLLTRKQNQVLKPQKKLDTIAAKSAQSKTVITRRGGRFVHTATVTNPVDEIPLCPFCKTKMKLKKPNKSQDWKPFWGCSNFKKTGCKCSRRYSGK